MRNLIIYLFIIHFKISAQYPTLLLSRADDEKTGVGNCPFCNSVCESRVKVKDEKNGSCNFGPYTLYPVLIEEFDYKEELLNNWAFNFGYTADDDYDSNHNGHIWMGTNENALANNVTVSSGTINFIIKKEHTSNGEAQTGHFKNYEFTGAALSSRFKTRYGIVKAEVKFPENNLLWPAVWKREKIQEIDIFEAWDDKISGSSCETYHQMKMHTHNSYGGAKCVRGRKFPLQSNFYSSFHNYRCDFTDYRLEYLLDDKVVGVATKYYQGSYSASGTCYKFTESGIPSIAHGCSSLFSQQDCDVWFPGSPPRPNKLPAWVPWPYIPPYCLIWNTVDKDEAFPKASTPMDFRISLAIRDVNNQKILTPGPNFNKTKCEVDPTDCHVVEDDLFNNWNSFSQTDKQFSVSRVEIYELINCGASYNINTISNFLNHTGNTNFLGGYSINFSNTSSVATFTNFAPVFANSYVEYPIHLLATEQISFTGGDVYFEEGTFLRAEIISCSNASFSQRTGEQPPTFSDQNSATEEEIKEAQKQRIEEYLKEHPEMRDSIYKMQGQEEYAQEMLKAYKDQNLTSLTDNGSIIVYPNPTKDILNIDMVEEDFNDILYLELTNSLGQSFKYPKTKQLDLTDFAPGMYQLKFIFSHGYIVVKSISKL